MKMLLLVTALVFAGCASTPQTVGSKATPTSSSLAAATPAARAPSAASTGPAAKVVVVRRDELADSYKLTMSDGTEYYCKKDAPTGTKLKKREQCFTREQLSEGADEARRQLRSVDRPQMPQQEAPAGLPAGFY